MIRLLYISHAVPNLTIEDVRAILKSSRKNNKAADITGVLVHGGGMFMQILEGEESAVLRLYLTIIADKRHINPRLVVVAPTADRLFQKWSMGNVECAPNEFEQIVQARSRRLEASNTDAFAGFAFEFAKMLFDQAPQE